MDQPMFMGRSHAVENAPCQPVRQRQGEASLVQHATQRAYLRKLLSERKQGATLDDYVLPARAFEPNPNVQLPHFLTPEFWDQLRERVLPGFDEQIASYALRPAA